jgi:hypothetical protein
MRTMRSLAGVLLSVSLLPTSLLAQRGRSADENAHDVLSSVFGPNWNLSVHAGSNNHGRFLLQRATLAGGAGGERVLRSHEGFTVGLGAGVDILLHTGVRFGYTYGSTDLVFRTDVGNGSEVLDVDDVGKLESHSVSVELLRYMLPSTASVTPYATVGFVGTWFSLNGELASVDDTEATQFRTGALAALGLKVELSERFDLRFEAGSGSTRNPFTGRDSYRVQSGTTIEEPTRVSRSSIRFVALYNLGKPDRDLRSARRAVRRR